MGEQRLRSRLRLAGLVLVASGLGSCEAVDDGPPSSLVLITVDTLRADKLGTYGGPAGLTPELDALAETSVVFERAYAPSSFTFPSISTLFTGRYPEENGILSNEYEIPPQVTTLATVLQAEGYTTGAVVSNYVLRRATRLDRGFDHYDDTFPQLERTRQVPERIASATTDAALAMLDRLRSASSRLFLWVHYQDPHGPYTPPEALRRSWLARERGTSGANRRLPAGRDHRGIGSIPNYQLLDGERTVGFYRAGYHAEIRFADEEIGRLLRGVAERDPTDTGVVVFTADHGEGLGEDDYWFAHGEHLTDPLTRVPLLVRLPHGEGRVRTDVVSLADLHRTLLDLFVPDREHPGRVGRDLFAPDAPSRDSTVYLATLQGSAVPRYGVVHDGFRYVVSLGAEPHERLHRLGDETHDLAASEPSVLRALRRQLAHERESLSTVIPVPQQPSETDLERLRSLGYVR